MSIIQLDPLERLEYDGHYHPYVTWRRVVSNYYYYYYTNILDIIHTQ